TSKSPSGPPEPPPLKVEIEIDELLKARGRDLGLADTVGFDATWGRLEAIYRARRHHPFWSNGRRLRHDAHRLLDTIHGVADVGLDPADYDVEHLERLAAQSERTSAPAIRLRPRILARFDVAATYAVWRIAEQMRAGR